MANEELLTEKDRIAYSAIVKFIKEHGYSPSVRELCGILGKSSTATIQYRLNSLGKKGFIKTSSGEKRTIQVTSEIKEIPTADVVEVVHGRWEDEHGGKYANPRYRCSVCKKRALYKFERDLLDNWKEVQALTPVCPYCMAKLDGGTDNDI